MRRCLLALVVALHACDCGFEPVADCDLDDTCDAGAMPDAGCADCVSTEVSWGYTGGRVAFADSSSITACQTYHHRRETFSQPPKTTTCEEPLASCPARLNALLAEPVIVGALSSHHLYGKDTRPVDGQVFQIDASGGWFEIGDCTPDCRPAKVKELQELLEALDAQQLAFEPCRSAFK